MEQVKIFQPSPALEAGTCQTSIERGTSSREYASEITATDNETLAFPRVQSFVESSLLFRRRPWLPDSLLDEQIALANRRFPFCFAALRPEADIDFRVTYRKPVKRYVWEPLRQLRIYIQAVIRCVRLKTKDRLHEVKYASSRPGRGTLAPRY